MADDDDDDDDDEDNVARDDVVAVPPDPARRWLLLAAATRPRDTALFILRTCSTGIFALGTVPTFFVTCCPSQLIVLPFVSRLSLIARSNQSIDRVS